MACYHNVISLGFCHTCGNGADADLTDQFDTDACAWVDVFQVVNQLRQVFNRVNIMVRWRRDQPHARH